MAFSFPEFTTSVIIRKFYVLSVEEPLTKEQIQVVEERLKLKE